MKLQKRIDALVRLGEHLRGDDEYLQAVVARTAHHNPWFTLEHQQLAIGAVAEKMLRREKLQEWLAAYAVPEETTPKTVGLVNQHLKKAKYASCSIPTRC